MLTNFPQFLNSDIIIHQSHVKNVQLKVLFYGLWIYDRVLLKFSEPISSKLPSFLWYFISWN